MEIQAKAKKFQEKRFNENKSLRAVSIEIGLSKSTINRFESGQIIPTKKVEFKVTKFLDEKR